MSENALYKLVDELRKNGVIAEISQVTMEKPEAFIKELRTIIELDFSLHDKVFEDKIAELENIINHKLGDWNKNGISYQEILDMKKENESLKQRIAELESKKRKRPCFVSYVGVENINGKEYVSMEKFATAMEELNAYFDGFFDRTDEDTMQKDIMRKWGI